MEIIRGQRREALKILLYGVPGIGKTTFASQFPKPVFIDTEGGSWNIDLARTPSPLSWAELTGQVQYFISHPDTLHTLVIDTADWAERLCIESICSSRKLHSLEDASYGRGYVYAAEEFGRLLNSLEELRKKNVHIVLNAHASIRKFEQPDELGAYDRWELKLGKKIAPMVKEWADMILFANYKTYVITTDDKKRKAQGGQRVMFTTFHPCWDAKNRFGLKDELPFDYGEIRGIIEGNGIPTPSAAPAPAVQPVAPPAPSQDTAAAVKAEHDDIPACVPPALRQLMQSCDVSLEEIIYAVSQRGHYTADTPFENYDPAYVQGVLIGAWEQVYAMIEKNRGNTPF